MKEGSPSTDAVSEANLKETAPMVLARWNTAAYKDNSTSRSLAEVIAYMGSAPDPVKEEDFKFQRVKIREVAPVGKQGR